MTQPYRLGFAVKILDGGGMKTHDSRRWQSGPHLSRSLELLAAAFEYLDRIDVRVYRMSSSTVPYGTHPDLPELGYRRQIDACEVQLAELGAKARKLGLRLSTHPGQYSVLNAENAAVAEKAIADVEQDALLLDALGQPAEGVVVIHVGGLYGHRASALDRWAACYERLSERARRRLVVEHDETSFDLDDVLELHRRTGVPVVFDSHHHRVNPGIWEDAGEALAAAYATWPDGVRPKVHVSSPRTELRTVGRGKTIRLVPPLLDQHADFTTPWDVADVLHLAPGPLDVMLEAKARIWPCSGCGGPSSESRLTSPRPRSAPPRRYAEPVPEGDSLRRYAERLKKLEGQVVAVETPHPRAQLLGLAEELDGKRLERIEAVGKNLLLTFEGGLVLRSHLRMKGRWHVRPAAHRYTGRPWLVLRGGDWQALQWNGPVLELRRRPPAAIRRLGPDIMDVRPDLDGMIGRLRAAGQTREIGEALLDQRAVAGIGNMWKAEALWLAGVSPWTSVGEVSDEDLRRVLDAAHDAMSAPRPRRQAYRRAGLPCRRCGEVIRSWPQGDEARTAYWCPRCQAGTEHATA